MTAKVAGYPGISPPASRSTRTRSSASPRSPGSGHGTRESLPRTDLSSAARRPAPGNSRLCAARAARLIRAPSCKHETLPYLRIRSTCRSPSCCYTPAGSGTNLKAAGKDVPVVSKIYETTPSSTNAAAPPRAAHWARIMLRHVPLSAHVVTGCTNNRRKTSTLVRPSQASASLKSPQGRSGTIAPCVGRAQRGVVR
jgi:hypothetical protein